MRRRGTLSERGEMRATALQALASWVPDALGAGLNSVLRFSGISVYSSPNTPLSDLNVPEYIL